ncbi:SDR family NAD(P)-dependent oxidoreductase [Methanolobus psychrotolerans]|uniref:SDR family NAD(P)-dependent oxidoreductase n=1 Tax=Methanolobus psychrotolerans TaxID=1874706 RepID=UPI001F5CA7F6|nr:SDR family oxidoreductase [Methanolobus psychrotolerans]
MKGKKVLVTGASTGIGACIAELFASYGADVGIHYNKSEKEANDLLQKIKLNGGNAEIIQADLLDSSSYKNIIDSFICTFGGIDVLVNNAGGIYGFKHFIDLDEISWDETFTLNAKAPFFIAKEAFSYMAEHNGGKIINISSVSAKYGGSENSMHYGASKAALDAITNGLARAGVERNILVNSVRAGFVDTLFHKKIGRKNIDERIKMTPLKRAGVPKDIAKMVLFLASEAGDYITGEVFTVAGGD